MPARLARCRPVSHCAHYAGRVSNPSPVSPVQAAALAAGALPPVEEVRPGVWTLAVPFRGGVPESQYAAMRAPFQDGDFPGPVKYGYLNVGVVETGPPALLGRTVFCLYPHQTAYVVPAGAVTVVPDAVPPARAVLAGTVETAVNALWDAAPLVGDRVAVVGAGMVGCCVARLLARFPAVETSRKNSPGQSGSSTRPPSSSRSSRSGCDPVQNASSAGWVWNALT